MANNGRSKSAPPFYKKQQREYRRPTIKPTYFSTSKRHLENRQENSNKLTFSINDLPEIVDNKKTKKITNKNENYNELIPNPVKLLPSLSRVMPNTLIEKSTVNKSKSIENIFKVTFSWLLVIE